MGSFKVFEESDEGKGATFFFFSPPQLSYGKCLLFRWISVLSLGGFPFSFLYSNFPHGLEIFTQHTL